MYEINLRDMDGLDIEYLASVQHSCLGTELSSSLRLSTGGVLCKRKMALPSQQ